jgi:hypothetical protein
MVYPKFAEHTLYLLFCMWLTVNNIVVVAAAGVVVVVLAIEENIAVFYRLLIAVNVNAHLGAPFEVLRWFADPN